MNGSRADLLAMADRIEAGVQTLAYEAENATPVLENRGYAGQGDQAESFAGRHADAAMAAQQYADGLRDTAANMSDTDRMGADFRAGAERVADATELGGILIDGRPLDRLAEGSFWSSDSTREGPSYGDQRAAEVEASGAFQHVADDGQVPFFQLSTGETDWSASGQAQETTGTDTADEGMSA